MVPDKHKLVSENSLQLLPVQHLQKARVTTMTSFPDTVPSIRRQVFYNVQTGRFLNPAPMQRFTSATTSGSFPLSTGRDPDIS